MRQNESLLTMHRGMALVMWFFWRNNGLYKYRTLCCELQWRLWRPFAWPIRQIARVFRDGRPRRRPGSYG